MVGSAAMAHEKLSSHHATKLSLRPHNTTAIIITIIIYEDPIRSVTIDIIMYV